MRLLETQTKENIRTITFTECIRRLHRITSTNSDKDTFYVAYNPLFNLSAFLEPYNVADYFIRECMVARDGSGRVSVAQNELQFNRPYPFTVGVILSEGWQILKCTNLKIDFDFKEYEQNYGEN